MTTRAQQFEIFAVGAMYNGSVVSDGYARFYAAGTTTLKNAYDDKDKSVSCTTKALDSEGRAEVYGDGIYKIRIYEGDPDDSGVLRVEIDNYKCTAVVGNVVKVTDDYTADRDDYMVLVDTTSKSITVSLDDVNNFDNPITIKKIHANNTVTIDPYSTQTIDGNSTVTITTNNDTEILVPDVETDVWRRGNTFVGLTASVDEINTVADGITATASEINASEAITSALTATPSEINTAADGIANPPIAGDSTAGRVLRNLYLHIQDATDAGKIQLTLYQSFPSDSTIATSDNIPDSGASFTNGFKWVSGSAANYIHVDASTLGFNVVDHIGHTIAYNDSGTSLTFGWEAAAAANVLNLWFYTEPTESTFSLGTLVDTGEIRANILVLSDS